MSDERNFPWLNEVANSSAGASQTQREMSPQFFAMDIDYDSLDEQVHIVASATHDIPSPAIIHSDGDDAMDLDEDEVPSPSPSPGPVDHSSSNNEVSTSTIPSLEEYLAQSSNEKPAPSDHDVFYEHFSRYASSGYVSSFITTRSESLCSALQSRHPFSSRLRGCAQHS